MWWLVVEQSARHYLAFSFQLQSKQQSIVFIGQYGIDSARGIATVFNEIDLHGDSPE
jgi:hypothetical protein